MSTRHLVDPALAPLLGLFPTRDLTADTLAATRQMLTDRMAGVAACAPDEVREVPGPAGTPAVVVRLFRPDGGDAPVPTILHLHGGGFVAGTAAGSDLANAERAARHGAVVDDVAVAIARLPGRGAVTPP